MAKIIFDYDNYEVRLNKESDEIDEYIAEDIIAYSIYHALKYRVNHGEDIEDALERLEIKLHDMVEDSYCLYPSEDGYGKVMLRPENEN